MAFDKKNSKVYLLLIILIDIVCACLAVYVGIKLRYGLFSPLPPLYAQNLSLYMMAVTAASLVSNCIWRCYNIVCVYFSYKDLARQFCSCILTSALFSLICYFTPLTMPAESYILVPFVAFVFMVICRFAPKAYRIFKARKPAQSTTHGRVAKILIYGAGEAGNYLLSNLDRGKKKMSPMGFLDDNESLWGRKIGQLPILGGGDMLESVIANDHINEVVIAIPTAPPGLIKDVYMRCTKCGVVVKRYGSFTDVTVDDFRNAPIKQVDFAELLRRDSVYLNMRIVNNFLKDKVVMVTGGVGSIGSEICRQVLKFGVKQLIIFDINENGLFFINNELIELGYEGKFLTLLGSVRDRNRLKEIFGQYEPDIVFHAAAHKHVPMMERNPKESIKNNVLGTINVANEAIFHSVQKFILISTDKAVNPTNIMGASKRIAEIATQIMNSVSDTEFAAVRFGNVLGSNGSVVPFFEKQIEQGGPVTVTHPEMKRYFMTIPEAVQLVLEAGAMASGGEIFVLDMGEPVFIYDLACDLIKMHGLEPGKDIEIVFSGLRPGEKLFEEISLAEEDTVKTGNNKIYINKPVSYDATWFSRNIKQLETAVRNPDVDEMFEIVRKMVPTFNHNKGDSNE